MTEAVMQRDTPMPRPPGSTGPGLLLALLVHAALVVAIAFSVRWRASEPEGLQAELWSSIPQVAAPPAPPPPPPVAPPAPPEPPPPARPQPQPEVDAQIALEKAREEEAEKRRREEAERLAELRRQEEEEKRLAEERRKAEEEKRLAEQRRKEQEEKRLAEERRKAEEEKRLAEQRRKAEEEKKRLAEERRLAEEEKKRLAELEQARERRLERLMAQAGATGDPSSTGTALRSAGPSAGYAGRIKARIKPNIVFTENPAGNPIAEVEVKLAPDGTIVSHTLSRPSGSREWDEAVLRAIERTQVLPRDVDGTVPPRMTIAFRPRD
jgi:colicin import membrane protein